ncbi:MAG: hypothetical protein HWE30_03165 [Methylocystaceae bacterium]|nr:hypothetical protein [Methylocystaceae bacterium]
MDKDRETLKFRTKWLHNTVKVLKTSCKNYHDDTQVRIDQIVKSREAASEATK